MRRALLVISTTALLALAGCSCEEGPGYSRVSVTDTRARSSAWRPLEVDATQLPAEAAVTRTERRNDDHQPEFDVAVDSPVPFKVVLVPTARPADRP